MFKCDKCGKCCRNLHKSPVYANLHDPENLKAASVLFEIADPNWVGSSRKCDQWGCLSSEDKFNKGHQAMRRFLALVANRDLRNKVFGF